MNTFFLVWFSMAFVLYLLKTIILILDREVEKETWYLISIAVNGFVTGAFLSLLINVLTIWK